SRAGRGAFGHRRDGQPGRLYVPPLFVGAAPAPNVGAIPGPVLRVVSAPQSRAGTGHLFRYPMAGSGGPVLGHGDAQAPSAIRDIAPVHLHLHRYRAELVSQTRRRAGAASQVANDAAVGKAPPTPPDRSISAPAGCARFAVPGAF